MSRLYTGVDWLIYTGLVVALVSLGIFKPKEVKKIDVEAEKLVSYMKTQKIDPDYLRYVVAETRVFSEKLGHEKHLKTILAMWYTESRYIQDADDGDSYGIAQTRKRYEKRLRKFWDDRGIELGSIQDPATQVAFGVAEFHEKWHYARRHKNRLWDTVRRYNGSGPAARAHANRVFRFRKAIFGE